MSNLTRNSLLALCAATALSLGVAQAQTPAAPTTSAAPAAVKQLTIPEIYQRVEAAGYKEVRKIELDDGRYEVKARNAEGEKVKLYISPESGEIERASNKK